MSRGMSAHGVSAQVCLGGVCPGGVSAQLGVFAQGVSVQGVSTQGVYTPPDPEADTPNRMLKDTHPCPLHTGIHPFPHKQND